LFQKLALVVGARARYPQTTMPKPIPLMASPTKKKTKSKTFQILKKSKLKDLLCLFEGLNSSLAQSPGKLWSCQVMQNLWPTRDFEV